MKKIIVALSLGILLTACKSTFIPSADEKSYSYPAQSKSFTFIKAPAGLTGVTINDVRSETLTTLKNLSNYGRCAPICKSYAGGGSGIIDIRGAEYRINDNTLNISYLNGEHYSSTGRKSYTKIHTSFNFDIAETEKEIILTLHSAKEAMVKPERSPVMIPYFPLMNEEKLNKKLSYVFNNFQRPSITKSGSHSTNGEFDVPFDPASVITNFERLATRMNNSSSSTERKYSDTFKVRLDGVVADVGIKVYLYRGNSKVSYRISYPYKVYDNGKHTSDSGNALKLFEAKVKEIANS